MLVLVVLAILRPEEDLFMRNRLKDIRAQGVSKDIEKILIKDAGVHREAQVMVHNEVFVHKHDLKHDKEDLGIHQHRDKEGMSANHGKIEGMINNSQEEAGRGAGGLVIGEGQAEEEEGKGKDNV